MQVHGLCLNVDDGTGVPNIVAAAYDGSCNLDNLSARPRIGSALSDASGAFTVSIDNGALKVKARDSVPSFVIALFAPEDVAERFTRQRDAVDRLLYLSEEILVSGVTAEAIVVRLSADVISKRRLQFSTNAPEASSSSAMESVADQIERYTNVALDQQKVYEGVNERLADKRKSLQDEDNKRRTAARAVAAKINALPVALRDPRTQKSAFIIVGKANVASNLAATQSDAITAGIAIAAKATLKPFTLNVTAAQAKTLGIVGVPVGSGPTGTQGSASANMIKIDPKVFFGVVREIVPSYDLFFPEPPPTAALARLAQVYLNPETSSNTSSTAGTRGQSAASAENH